MPTIEVTLPPDTDTPRRARRFIQDALDEGAPDDVVDIAVLLVSEVVTNAVLHARSEVCVGITWQSGRVRVEVSDRSPVRPVARRFAEDAGTGRGMLLVEELADAWGMRPAADGKVVWFELASVA